MPSGDGTAVCSCFEFGYIVIRHQARFVECDDAFVVGWGRRKQPQEGLDKRRQRRMQEADVLVDLGKPCANRLAIERHGLTGVSRQDERLRRQREELVQAVVEMRGARSRFLLTGVQVRTPDAGRKEGIARKEDGIIEQVTGALRRVSRRAQRGQHQVRDGERVPIPHGRKGK